MNTFSNTDAAPSEKFSHPITVGQPCKLCQQKALDHNAVTWECPKPKHRGHPRFHELVREIIDLHNKKNQEYTEGGLQGPLGNFRRVSEIMRLYPGMDWDSPLGVALVYSLKQLDGALIQRSTKRGSVVGEPIGSRLRDDSIYKLIAIILEEEEQKEELPF